MDDEDIKKCLDMLDDTVDFLADLELELKDEQKDELTAVGLHDLRPDPLLFFKPTHPAFQAHFRQAARSANHNSLWFTSPQTTSLIRSYFFSGFRYLSPIIRHVLTFRMACST